MAMMVSDEVRTLFQVLTGEEWPDANEDQLRALADAWQTAATRLTTQLAPEMHHAVVTIRAEFEGQAEQAFAMRMSPFVEGANNYLATANDQFNKMAKFLRDLALDVEYMKIVSIITLGTLIAEIAWATAMAFWTGGASMAWLAARIAVVRWLLKTLIGRFVIQLVQAVAFGIAFQVLIDMLAQSIQFGMGTRDSWDWKKTRDGAAVGALGGVLSPFAGLLGNGISRLSKDGLDKVLGKVLEGRDWHKDLPKAITDMGIEAFQETFTEALYKYITEGEFELNPYSATSGAISGAGNVIGDEMSHVLGNNNGPGTTTPPPVTPRPEDEQSDDSAVGTEGDNDSSIITDPPPVTPPRDTTDTPAGADDGLNDPTRPDDPDQDSGRTPPDDDGPLAGIGDPDDVGAPVGGVHAPDDDTITSDATTAPHDGLTGPAVVPPIADGPAVLTPPSSGPGQGRAPGDDGVTTPSGDDVATGGTTDPGRTVPPPPGHTESVQVPPGQAGSGQTGSSQTSSSQNGSGQPGSGQAGSGQPDSLAPDPSQTDSAQPGPVGTGLSQADPSQADPSQADPSQADPSQTGPSQTEAPPTGSTTTESVPTGLGTTTPPPTGTQPDQPQAMAPPVTSQDLPAAGESSLPGSAADVHLTPHSTSPSADRSTVDEAPAATANPARDSGTEPTSTGRPSVVEGSADGARTQVTTPAPVMAANGQPQGTNQGTGTGKPGDAAAAPSSAPRKAGKAKRSVKRDDQPAALPDTSAATTAPVTVAAPDSTLQRDSEVAQAGIEPPAPRPKQDEKSNPAQTSKNPQAPRPNPFRNTPESSTPPTPVAVPDNQASQRLSDLRDLARSWFDARVEFERRSREYEQRLAVYLLQRKDVQTAFGRFVNEVWGRVDARRRGELGETEGLTAGAVGTGAAVNQQVVREGNIRERITLLWSIARDDQLIQQLPALHDRSPEIQGERPQRKQTEADRALTEAVLDTSAPPEERARRQAEAESRMRIPVHPDEVVPPLSARERKLAVRDGVLTWAPAEKRMDMVLSGGLHRESEHTGGLVTTGTSGSTFLVLNLARLVNERWKARIDLELVRLGLIGFMLSTGQHTYHEVMRAANLADPSLTYDDNFGRYQRLSPVTEQELRANVAVDGLFPDEHAVALVNWNSAREIVLELPTTPPIGSPAGSPADSPVESRAGSPFELEQRLSWSSNEAITYLDSLVERYLPDSGSARWSLEDELAAVNRPPSDAPRWELENELAAVERPRSDAGPWELEKELAGARQGNADAPSTPDERDSLVDYYERQLAADRDDAPGDRPQRRVRFASTDDVRVFHDGDENPGKAFGRFDEDFVETRPDATQDDGVEVLRLTDSEDDVLWQEGFGDRPVPVPPAPHTTIVFAEGSKTLDPRASEKVRTLGLGLFDESIERRQAGGHAPQVAIVGYGNSRTHGRESGLARAEAVRDLLKTTLEAELARRTRLGADLADLPDVTAFDPPVVSGGRSDNPRTEGPDLTTRRRSVVVDVVPIPEMLSNPWPAVQTREAAVETPAPTSAPAPAPAPVHLDDPGSLRPSARGRHTGPFDDGGVFADFDADTTRDDVSEVLSEASDTPSTPNTIELDVLWEEALGDRPLPAHPAPHTTVTFPAGSTTLDPDGARTVRQVGLGLFDAMAERRRAGGHGPHVTIAGYGNSRAGGEETGLARAQAVRDLLNSTLREEFDRRVRLGADRSALPDVASFDPPAVSGGRSDNPRTEGPDLITRRRSVVIDVIPVPDLIANPAAPQQSVFRNQPEHPDGAQPSASGTAPAPQPQHDVRVLDDESWRHFPGPAADWMAPDPRPLHRDQWEHLRSDDPTTYTHVESELVGIHNDSAFEPDEQGRLRPVLNSYIAPVRHDVRRIEAEPGRWVKEFTLKVHLDVQEGVDPARVPVLRQNVLRGVDRMYNQGYRMPDGDQFHVRIEFIDDPAQSHQTVRVVPDVDGFPFDEWSIGANPHDLAHELGHSGFALFDAYRHNSLALQDKAAGSQHRDAKGKPVAEVSNRVVRDEDSGLMSLSYRPDTVLRPRELWQIGRNLADTSKIVVETPYAPPSDDVSSSLFERAAGGDLGAKITLAGQGHADSLRDLGELSRSGDRGAREALVALGAQGELHALDALTRSGDTGTHTGLGGVTAVQRLSQLGHEQVPNRLAKALLDDLASDGFFAAVTELAGRGDPAARDQLRRHARTGNDDALTAMIRHADVDGLVSLAGEHDGAYSGLVELASGGNPDAVSRLHALGDVDGLVSAAGGRQGPAYDALKELAGRGDGAALAEVVVMHDVPTLIKLAVGGNQHAITALEDFAADGDRDASDAVTVVELVESGDVDRLAQYASDQWQAFEGIKALAELGDPVAVDTLGLFAAQGDDISRAELRTLASGGSREAVVALMRNSDVGGLTEVALSGNRTAVSALRQLAAAGNREATDALDRQRRDAIDALVRQQDIDTLTAIALKGDDYARGALESLTGKGGMSASESPFSNTPAPKLDVPIPRIADTFVVELFNELDVVVDTAPRPPGLRDGDWSSERPADSGPLTPQRLETELGIPQVNQQRFQKLADRFNLVYDVRPTNPDSVPWLEKHATPKPKDIKAKTISSLDVPLGASPHQIGLVGYFDPVKPDLTQVPAELHRRVRQRYDNRRQEFTALAAEMADLEAQGRYRVENGVVQANTADDFTDVTGDHDVYHIRRPDDGASLAVDDYDLAVWVLTNRDMGVQHGAHMYWQPQGSFQEKIFNDIVSRHQSTAPDAEPLIRFSPGEPPSLVYADPRPQIVVFGSAPVDQARAAADAAERALDHARTEVVAADESVTAAAEQTRSTAAEVAGLTAEVDAALARVDSARSAFVKTNGEGTGQGGDRELAVALGELNAAQQDLSLAEEARSAAVQHELGARRTAHDARVTMLQTRRTVADADSAHAAAQAGLDQAQSALRDGQTAVESAIGHRDLAVERHTSPVRARDEVQARITATEQDLATTRAKADVEQRTGWEARTQVEQRLHGFEAAAGLSERVAGAEKKLGKLSQSKYDDLVNRATTIVSGDHHVPVFIETMTPEVAHRRTLIDQVTVLVAEALHTSGGDDGAARELSRELARELHTRRTNLAGGAEFRPDPHGVLAPEDFVVTFEPEQADGVPSSVAPAVSDGADFSSVAPQFEHRYQTVLSRLRNLAVPDLRQRLAELSELAGDGRLENYTAQVLEAPKIARALRRIDTHLPALPDKAIRDQVRALITDAVMVTSLVPSRERDVRDMSRLGLGTVRERLVVQPLTVHRLEQVLSDIAANVRAGRNPFTAPLSTVRETGFVSSEPLPLRLTRLGMVNLTADARAQLRQDELFLALLDNPAALTETLFATNGHDEQHFMNTCDPATTNREVRTKVPTIAGLLMVGRGVVTQVESQLASASPQRLARRDRLFGRTIEDLARSRIRDATHHFDRIEARARELATANRSDVPTRQAWTDLTRRWGRTMQKLAGVTNLDAADGAPVPVLTKKPFRGAWGLSMPVAVFTGIDRPERRLSSVGGAEYFASVSRYLAPDPRDETTKQAWDTPSVRLSGRIGTLQRVGEFWTSLQAGHPVRVHSPLHEMTLGTTEAGGEPMFVLSDPKKAQFDLLSFEQLISWARDNSIEIGKDVFDDRPVVVPSESAADFPLLTGIAPPDDIGDAPVPRPTVVDDYTLVDEGGLPSFQGITPLDVSTGELADLSSFPGVALTQSETRYNRPPLRLSVDGKLAINGMNATSLGVEAKEFWATPELVDTAQQSLRKAGANVRLVTPGATVTVDHNGEPVTLHRVTAEFDDAPPDVCRDFAGNLLGGLPDVAVFRVPDSAPRVAGISSTSGVEVTGTHTLAEGMAEVVVGGGDLSSITPSWAADEMAVDTRPTGGDGKAPLPGPSYGRAQNYHPDNAPVRRRMDRLSASIGVNKFADPRPGEAFMIHSVGSPSADGVTPMAVNHARGGPVGAVYGYHFGTVVAESADGRTKITLENYARSGKLRRAAEQAVAENLVAYRGRFTELGEHWGLELAEARARGDLRAVHEAQTRVGLVDALKTMADLDDSAQADPEPAARREEAERTAVNAVLQLSDTLRPGDLWHFKMYSAEPGETFHEQRAAFHDLNKPVTMVNPVTLVVTGGHKMSETTPIIFDEGATSLDDSNAPAIDSAARKIARDAIWRHDNGMPMPEITVTGFGNGKIGTGRSAISTGKARADSVAQALGHALEEFLEHHQRDSSSSVGKNDIKIVALSGGRDVPESSPSYSLREHRRRATISVGTPAVTDAVVAGDNSDRQPVVGAAPWAVDRLAREVSDGRAEQSIGTDEPAAVRPPEEAPLNARVETAPPSQQLSDVPMPGGPDTGTKPWNTQATTDTIAADWNAGQEQQLFSPPPDFSSAAEVYEEITRSPDGRWHVLGDDGEPAMAWHGGANLFGLFDDAGPRQENTYVSDPSGRLLRDVPVFEWTVGDPANQPVAYSQSRTENLPEVATASSTPPADRAGYAIEGYDFTFADSYARWRTSDEVLYHFSKKDPQQIVAEGGLAPKGRGTGRHLVDYVYNGHQDTQFMSATSDPGAMSKFKEANPGHTFGSMYKYVYRFRAPGGIDVNATLDLASPFPDQKEITFPGGVRSEHIIGFQLVMNDRPFGAVISMPQPAADVIAGPAARSTDLPVAVQALASQDGPRSAKRGRDEFESGLGGEVTTLEPRGVLPPLDQQLTPPSPDEVRALRDAVPQGTRFTDPARWVGLINGSRSAAGRNVNCVDAALAFHSTYRGEPRVAGASTTGGTLTGTGTAISEATPYAPEWMGHGSQALSEVVNRVTRGGHGSDAVVVGFPDRRGPGHVWNVVNHNGTVSLVDAQSGTMQPASGDSIPGLGRVYSIPMDANGEFIGPASGADDEVTSPAVDQAGETGVSAPTDTMAGPWRDEHDSDALSEVEVEHAPEWVGRGAAALQEVVDRLARGGDGTAAVVTTFAKDGAEIGTVGLVNRDGEVLLNDGTPMPADMLGDAARVYVVAFDADGELVTSGPLTVPSVSQVAGPEVIDEYGRVMAEPEPDLDAYLTWLDEQIAKTGKADRERQAELALHRREVDTYRMKLELVRDGEVSLRGGGRLVPGLGGLRLVGDAVSATLAADLAALLGRDVIALVIGADAEEPRELKFPPRGRPLPVR